MSSYSQPILRSGAEILEYIEQRIQLAERSRKPLHLPELYRLQAFIECRAVEPAKIDVPRSEINSEAIERLTGRKTRPHITRCENRMCKAPLSIDVPTIVEDKTAYTYCPHCQERTEFNTLGYLNNTDSVFKNTIGANNLCQ